MTASRRIRGKGLYRNMVSYVGLLVMLGSSGMILFALLLEFGLMDPSPYLGIFTYMVLPVFLFMGFTVFLYGTRRESLRRRKAGTTEALPFPRLDLNDPVHRRRFGWVLGGGSILGVLLVFVGYNAFLFTESVTFCGEVCHTVMEPEHSAYLSSPHARVTCVECHVGHGADWYVKSKLSGARQLLAVMLDSYQRPIPAPIHNLRPARETCEQCHWPQKFFGARMMQNPHYRYDEKNTAEQVSLMVKTGGGGADSGGSEGIHWHTVVANEVSFRVADRKLQDVVWFSAKDCDGKVTEYFSRDHDLDSGQLEALPLHILDCMDCHNRPTHIFHPPDGAVDRAMASGVISPDLPWIKKVAVDALVKPYADKTAARAGIRGEIEDFYKARYPEVARKDADKVEGTWQAVSAIWERSVFPAMNVDWKTYASNIGHRNWPGCFRCHDGRHVTREGKALSMDCTLCHTMPLRGPRMPLGTEAPVSDLDWHRWKLEGKHARMRCDRCHQAGFRPPLDCAECHGIDRQAPMMTDMDCGDCHSEDQAVLPLEDCADCHENLGGLHGEGEHPEADCIDCHKPHGWKTADTTCRDCHEELEGHADRAGPCVKCHSFAMPEAESESAEESGAL